MKKSSAVKPEWRSPCSNAHALSAVIPGLLEVVKAGSRDVAKCNYILYKATQTAKVVAISGELVSLCVAVVSVCGQSCSANVRWPSHSSVIPSHTKFHLPSIKVCACG